MDPAVLVALCTVAAAAGSLVVKVIPAVLRLFSGKAESVRQDHELVVADIRGQMTLMQTVIDHLRARDDERTRQLLALTREVGECNAERKLQTEELARLHAELMTVKHRLDPEPPGP